MKKEKIQYIFIYFVIVAIPIVLVIIGYCVFDSMKWDKYKSDPDKKNSVLGIEKILKKPEKERQASDYFELGKNYYSIEEYKLALSSYQKSLKMGYNVAQYNIADVYIATEDYKKAENVYLDMISKDGAQIDAYLAAAELYKKWDGGKYKVLSIFELGLENNLNNYDLLIKLGDYYKENGNKEKALEYYQKALDTHPERAEETKNMISGLQ